MSEFKHGQKVNMIWSKYENRFSKIMQSYPDKVALRKQYVHEPMEIAIGTMEQLAQTKKDLEKAFEAMYKELCKTANAQRNTITDEYMTELYEKEGCKNKAINDLCYDRAYDRAHNCGYREVETLFAEEIEYAKRIISAAGLKHE